MSEPLVCAIMLVNGRPAMVRRAIASFRAQSYENKHLLILDTSEKVITLSTPASELYNDAGHTTIMEASQARTIGALRNRSMEMVGWRVKRAEIICTFDSDDWSNPNRIAEQVALLQSSNAEVTGYYEAAFYDSRPGKEGAWIYKAMVPKHIVGASMAFTRAAWTRRPFDETLNVGEDYRFCSGCRVVGVSGLGNPPPFGFGKPTVNDNEPRLVASIHGQNTAPYNEFSRQTWRRAPELDEYCRNKMILEAQP